MNWPRMLAAVLLGGTAALWAGCQTGPESSFHTTRRPLDPEGGILFTEYVEGSGHNKALEISNHGTQPAALGDCLVELFANGSYFPTSQIQLDEVELPPGASWVLCHSGFEAPQRCQQLDYSLYHNGNDAIRLRCAQEVQDTIGRIGEDPGPGWGVGEWTTVDQTLLRDCALVQGDPDASDPFDPAGQWNPLGPDVFADLGTGCQADIAVGSPQTLEIATWNLRNFPADGSTASRVAGLIRKMDLDLVAVQEIASIKEFEELLGLLDDYDGVLSDHTYPWTYYYQKTGYIYRQDLIDLEGVQSLFEGLWYMPRPVLRAGFRVNRPDGRPLELVLLNAHLKSGVSPDDRHMRERACQKIKSHVDELLGEPIPSRVIILGDLNDQLDDIPEYNVFNAFLDDPATYQFETAGMASQAGAYSLITSQRLVDHILTTPTVEAALPGSSTLTVPLEAALSDCDYQAQVSDHRPVVSIFPW